MNSLAIKTNTSLTATWVNFFTAAGIPSDVSATYALTFTENRIQNDMLLELNKEYLRDMGITRMGDVIAILRHAKQVHESAARERVLSSAVKSQPKVPVAAVAGRLTASQNKVSSAASRILEHYTRNTTSAETSPVSSPQLKRKLSDSSSDATDDVKKSRLIRFSSKSASTQVALKETPVTKQTVFARLGDSDVVKKTITDAPAKPIYARLGDKTESNVSTQASIPISKDALRYEGILKSQPIKKVTITTTRNNERKIACTMRADEEPVKIKEKLQLPKSKSVKFSNTVEFKEIEAVNSKEFKPKFTPVFNKPERRLSMPNNQKTVTMSGVKARLGIKNTNNYTVTKSVRSRLGI